MSDQERVIFVCTREPELSIVLQCDESAIVDGHVVKRKPVYARFLRGPYGGQFETSDKAVIDFIKSRPKFINGAIIAVPLSEMKGWKQGRRVVARNERVATGAISTNASPVTPPPPEGEPPQPIAAVVPGLSGKTEAPSAEVEDTPSTDAPNANLDPEAGQEPEIKKSPF